jgi:mannose-6-phosphate isomerase-like protein (cupin superfamily)
MKPLTKAILALAAASLIGAGCATQRPKTESVIYFPHAQVDATFTKGGGMMLQTNNYKVIAGRRGGPGAVEIHEKDTDVFYILEGNATFITGGTANEVKQIGPGEFTAKNITGGDVRQMEKGDVIVIPNLVPHWFTNTSVPFNYFVVKVSK